MYLNNLPVFTFIILVSFMLCVVVTLFILAFAFRGTLKYRSWFIGSGLVASSFALFCQSLIAQPKVPGNDSIYLEPCPGWVYVPILFVGLGFSIHAAFRTIIQKRAADEQGVDKQPKLSRVRTSRRAPKGEAAGATADSSSILGFTGTND